MAEPTLGEILSIPVDSSLGGGVPAAPFDNRLMLQQLHENSKLRAENTWKKYNLFQQQLGELFKNIDDISGLEVLSNDKEKLDIDRKNLLNSIWKNPKEFFGSGNMKKRADIEGLLSKYRTTATQSKQDSLIHEAHQKLLETNPELNTPDNRKIVDDFIKQPLGSRKLPALRMPVIFDPSQILKSTLGTGGIAVRTMPTLEQRDGFNIEGTKTTYDRDLAMSVWMGSLYAPDKYGQSHYRYAQDEFDKLTPKQKEKYIKVAPGNTEDDKQKQLEAFWRDLGEQQMPFRSNAISQWNELSEEERAKYKGGFDEFYQQNKDIIKKETQKITPDPYVLDRQRAAERMDLLKERFGLMAGLEGLKQGNRKEIQKLIVSLRGLGPEAQADGIQVIANGLIDDAILSKNTVTIDGKEFYKMKASDPILNIYSKGSGLTKQTPHDIVVSPDGLTGYTVYYKDKDRKEVDPSRTKPLLMSNFSLDLSKSLIGQAGVRKMVTVKDKDKETETKKVKVPGL